jgi:hypothetical protein
MMPEGEVTSSSQVVVGRLAPSGAGDGAYTIAGNNLTEITILSYSF